MTPEWRTYACEPPAPAYGRTFPLDAIYHVTHANTAMRIIEDGQISRGLVFDHSKLNITRRTVVWLSPNTWFNGSRYGTVQFKFDWKSIVENKSIYWVEDMKDYQPSAVRFFITDKDVSGLPPVTPYDPVSDDGPLRRTSDQWWWNGSYTLEIMIDDELPLSICSETTFIQHHAKYCNIGHAQCTEIGKDGRVSGARVMAYILTTRRTSADSAFRDGSDLTGPAESALCDIGLMLGAMSSSFGGGPVREANAAEMVVRGSLAQLALGRKEEGKALAAQLKSKRVFWRALRGICHDHFGVSSSRIEEAAA